MTAAPYQPQYQPLGRLLRLPGPMPRTSTRWAATWPKAPGCSVSRTNSVRRASRCSAASAWNPGQSAIDLGCGPSGILDLLSDAVSPGGRVVGLDADRQHTAMARRYAREHKLAGVEVETADARHTGLPSDTFDLVHGRTAAGDDPRPRRGGRRDGPAGPAGRLGGQPGARLRVHPVLSVDTRLGPAARALPCWLQPVGRRPAHRPPPDRAVQERGPGRDRGGVVRPRLPGRSLAPHDTARPGAQPAPHDPGARPVR